MLFKKNIENGTIHAQGRKAEDPSQNVTTERANAYELLVDRSSIVDSITQSPTN